MRLVYLLIMLAIVTSGCSPSLEARRHRVESTFKSKLSAKSDKWNSITWDVNEPDKKDASVSATYGGEKVPIVLTGFVVTGPDYLNVTAKSGEGAMIANWEFRDGRDLKEISVEPDPPLEIQQLAKLAEDFASSLHASIEK